MQQSIEDKLQLNLGDIVTRGLGMPPSGLLELSTPNVRSGRIAAYLALDSTS